MNSCLLVNDVEIYKFEAEDSEINQVPLCLGNISKVFSDDNIRLDYMDIFIIFWLIMIVLMWIIF